MMVCWSAYDRLYSSIHNNPERFLGYGSHWRDKKTWEQLGTRSKEDLEGLYNLLSINTDNRISTLINSNPDRFLGNGSMWADGQYLNQLQTRSEGELYMVYTLLSQSNFNLQYIKFTICINGR